MRRLRSTCKLFRTFVSEARCFEWRFFELDSRTRFLTFISNNLGGRWKRLKLNDFATCPLDLRSIIPAILPFVETFESITIVFRKEGNKAGDLPGSEILFPMLEACRSLKHICIQCEGPAAAISCRVETPPAKPLIALTKLCLFNLCSKGCARIATSVSFSAAPLRQHQ